MNPKVAGALVRMEVVAGPNTGATDDDRTNSGGEADLRYRGDGGEGTDLILAWVDIDNDGVVDSGEEQATATKFWTPGEPGALLPEDIEEACEELDETSHPSLAALCDVTANGELSERARTVIEGIILRKSGWMFPGNPECHGNANGFGNGRWNSRGDDGCVTIDDDDAYPGRGRGRPDHAGKDNDDD